MKNQKDRSLPAFSEEPREQLRGVLATAGTFIFWGIMPIYWHAIASVSPLEILGHRIVWSVVFLGVLLAFQNRWKEVTASLGSGKTLAFLLASSATIACNWLLYIWAVNSGHVLDASLGYFINPLLNALLGILFLRERLRKLQILALALAGTGVLYQVLLHGSLPLIALGIGGTFSLYGLIRKKAEIRPLPGLFVETSLLFLPALAFLGYCSFSGTLDFAHHNLRLDLLLLGCGAVTSIPLMTFAYGAKRLRLTTVGILQYLSPTLSFLLGLFFFGESMKAGDAVTFCLIWGALALYSGETLFYARNTGRSSPLAQKENP